MFVFGVCVQVCVYVFFCVLCVLIHYLAAVDAK